MPSLLGCNGGLSDRLLATRTVPGITGTGTTEAVDVADLGEESPLLGARGTSRRLLKTIPALVGRNGACWTFDFGDGTPLCVGEWLRCLHPWKVQVKRGRERCFRRYKRCNTDSSKGVGVAETSEHAWHCYNSHARVCCGGAVPESNLGASCATRSVASLIS